MNEIYRAPWRDYKQRGIYMITLSKSSLVGPFGELVGDYRVPIGRKGSPFVWASPIGIAIKENLRKFFLIEPNIRILQYALMPDHVHILLFVVRELKEILGRVIARFKVAVNKTAAMESVFAKGFNDQILKPSRSLDALYCYLRENPYRLAVRRAHPEYFKRVNRLRIGDQVYQAYGNFQLLRNPFKEQVVVHRADTPEQRARNREEWLYVGANGGVLASPYISAAEKDIFREAIEIGSKFIFLTNEKMGERYKPSGLHFSLCEQGRMLILCPEGLPEANGRTLTRAQALMLNRCAEKIIAI